jgi:hypothetical protein
MLKLKHNQPRVKPIIQERSSRRSPVLRLAGWLRRRLTRDCAAGVWTLSRDGKLACESLRAELGGSD